MATRKRILIVSGSRADLGLLHCPEKALREDGHEVNLCAIGGEFGYAFSVTSGLLAGFQPDLMLVLGDRFEILAAATAAHLRKAAYSLFISARRRAGRVTTVDNVESLEVAWKEWAGDDNGEAALVALRDCLQQLTERARWALEMRFRDKLPRLEIAAALEITEHGAKNLMQRAKQQLRRCVETKLK